VLARLEDARGAGHVLLAALLCSSQLEFRVVDDADKTVAGLGLPPGITLEWDRYEGPGALPCRRPTCAALAAVSLANNSGAGCVEVTCTYGRFSRRTSSAHDIVDVLAGETRLAGADTSARSPCSPWSCWSGNSRRGSAVPYVRASCGRRSLLRR